MKEARSHMNDMTISEMQAVVRKFASERQWEIFHTPKNLAMAVAGEAGELAEVFQWLSPEQSIALDDETLAHAGEEIVDVLQYLVRLADVLDIDLDKAFSEKIAKNEMRFPRI